MIGTTAAVAETTSKVHGSAANAAEHRAGLVLAVCTADLSVYPQTRLSAMMFARVTLLHPQTRRLVATVVNVIDVTLKPTV